MMFYFTMNQSEYAVQVFQCTTQPSFLEIQSLGRRKRPGLLEALLRSISPPPPKRVLHIRMSAEERRELLHAIANLRIRLVSEAGLRIRLMLAEKTMSPKFTVTSVTDLHVPELAFHAYLGEQSWVPRLMA
ncbi:hypothetical protein C8R47DRAFT_1207613 [Mycena vitilis]|nr:hypothetical protein C8R47DRAFT_1207613 [Mycena vitilis]